MQVTGRSVEPKTRPRASHAGLVYLSHDAQPPAITFAAGGRRYTYALPSPLALDNILYLARRVSVGKAFALAKRLGRLQ